MEGLYPQNLIYTVPEKGFPNNGIDTFENMANMGISIVDRVVIEKMGGHIDTEKDRWIIPN